MKTAIITGASGGLGTALCRAFANGGYNIVAQYNSNESAILSLKSEIEAQFSVNFQAVKADFEKREEIHSFAKTALENSGADVLVNNAGMSLVGLVQDIDEAQSDKIFKVNVQSMIELTKLVLPQMIANHQGKIINISSVWGVLGGSCEVHYSATKAAVVGFTKALAKEVGPSNINVNCIAPGFIETKMNSHLSPDEIEAFVSETPLCRLGKPSEVADLAVFLASEKASFITGQVIGIDGGIS